MNTIQNDNDNEKISTIDVFKELFKLGFPFLLIVLLYIFFVA
jgi:hypothetical protein